VSHTELQVAFVVGYVLCGIGTVLRETGAPMYQRPAWARHPTMGWVLLVVALWWLDAILNSRRSPRDVVAALVGAAVQVAVVGLGIYFCWWLATLVTENLIARLVIATVGVVVTQIFLSPLVKVPLTLVLMVLALPLRLLPGPRNDPSP